ncbi:MAG TPA: hypothetical protein VLU25_00115 [Acidobacteriota bacterium]|nr:hypothetical protein [Acidobacteriota bacterium]
MTESRAKKGSEKKAAEKPGKLSLQPLNFEEAVRAASNCKPMSREEIREWRKEERNGA